VEIGPGSRAIVSGATSGIGAATARALAARGARVGLLARGREGLAVLAAELEGAIELQADVGDAEAVEGAVARFAEEAGGVELVVANAGVARSGPFLELDAAEAEEMVRVNFTGTLNLLRAAVPLMLDRGRGHVVVVSSAAALRAFPWTAVYAGSKAAQRAFAEAFRHELSGTGVSLTTVFPGEVETALHAHEPERIPDWLRRGDAIAPETVAEAIVAAVLADRRQVHVPPAVRLLGLNSLAPGLVDRLVAMVRGGSAAPRRY
jgi:NADP-dependent 3-hydroxy acid dehydrogenase YdfG